MASSVKKLTKEIVKKYGNYLSGKMSSLTEVYEEFPSGNRKLKMPSVSIITEGKATFDPETSGAYVASSSDISGEPALKVIKYVIGQYEVPLQIDFWCRNKEERSQIYAEFVDAMTGQDITAEPQIGVILALTEYHNAFCHYDLGGYSFDDDETSSQRKEWRVKIDVVATCKAIVERTQSVILETEMQTEITDKPFTE